MIGVSFHAEFTVHGPDDEAMQEQAWAVLDHLLELEGADPRLTSSTVIIDVKARMVTIELAVEGMDVPDATTYAWGTIRAAIHAAGGGTSAMDAGIPEFRPGAQRAEPILA